MTASSTLKTTQPEKSYAQRCGIDLTKNLAYTVVKLPDGSLWPIPNVEELFVKDPSKVVETWKATLRGYKQLKPKPPGKSGKTRFRRSLCVFEAW